MRGEFEIVCEIEPATSPDLMRVRHQIGVMSGVASTFLIPDNHIGRATVSSIAVAHEVGLMGGRAIACLNARDRNILGFQRDLLTAGAYGVNEFLFVYGDRPETGSRSDDLTVRRMLDEARQFETSRYGAEGRFRLGVATTLKPLPQWKRTADFLFVQVSFDIEKLIQWRSTVDFDGPVYAGVLIPPSAAMARKLSAQIQELAVPDELVASLERDRDAGVSFAMDAIASIRASAVFDGVHVVPVTRYRELASALEGVLKRPT